MFLYWRDDINGEDDSNGDEDMIGARAVPYCPPPQRGVDNWRVAPLASGGYDRALWKEDMILEGEFE